MLILTGLLIFGAGLQTPVLFAEEIDTASSQQISVNNPTIRTLPRSQDNQNIPISRPCQNSRDIPPEIRVADDSDSWLVLYNLSNADSVAWAEFFKNAYCIPDENMLGISNVWPHDYLPNFAMLRDQIIIPVTTYLNEHPEIKSKIMGIVLGYAMPGKYCDWFNTQGGCNYPPTGSGLSVSNALQDLSDVMVEIETSQARDNINSQQLYFNGSNLPPRLTKQTLLADHYLVSRIDAPTLELAKDLTRRAKIISNSDHFLTNQKIYYDHSDIQRGLWANLGYVIPGGTLHSFFSEAVWQNFDSDTQPTSGFAAFRFDWHDTTNWNNGRLIDQGTSGSRILAYNLNSWGAVEVRSSTAGSRFVPNAIENGWAAAIGSTTEPLFLPLTPKPANLLACLKAGWTIAEAMYLSNPYDDWTWTLIADPFLKIPHWFGETE